MKIITKLCIASSIIFSILGAGLITAGMAMGVDPSQLLDLAHAKASTRRQMETFSSCEGYFGNADTDTLKLELAVCRLHIRTHDEDSVYLTADNAAHTFSVEEHGRQLILTDKRENPKDYLELTLCVPNRKFQEIRIEIGVGDADIQDLLMAEEMGIDAGCGNLNANLDADSLDINLGTGSAEIFLPGSEADYNYDLSCGIGSILLRSDTGQDSQHEDQGQLLGNLGSTLEKDNHAGRDIRVDNGLGSITVTFTEQN